VDHHLRRDRLASRLGELEIDAVLVTRLPNVRYLTGFTGSNAQALVRTGGGTFFTDGRYTEQARREAPDLERITYSQDFGAMVLAACRAAAVSRLGFESAGMTVRAHTKLRDELEGVELIPLGDEVEQLRWVKDAEEIRLLEQAQEATDQAFEDILEKLAVGLSEREVAQELEHAMRRAGADGLSFDTIVAFGENAAEPHHEPGHRTLEDGDVVKLDFGALWGGYHADMTRTVAFGTIAGELRRIYDVVHEAQRAGIEAVREGAKGGEVDAASREVVEAAGYGERFSHSLGHGVGLEVHEGPSLRREGTDVLPARSVVTVEPGVYVPGLGGVRIEDTVEVTSEGCRVIATAPKDLIEL
jgi:Xaa-Pro aminopeptidase